MALILLEPFQNVVNTGQAQCTTSRIWPNTLEYIALVMGGTFTKAEITLIQMRLGNKPIWTIVGADLQSLNSYEGRVATSTMLMMPFANAFARTPKQQYIGAIDFGQVQVQQATILVTITGATSPTLVGYAQVAPPKTLDPASNLLFRAILQTPLAPAGAATFSPYLINYGQSGGALLRRLMFVNEYVTALEIKRDGLDIYEQIADTLTAAIENELVPHVAQSDMLIYDATEDNIEAKALTSVRADSQGNISLIPQQINLTTTSSVSAFNAYADIFANLNGL